MQVRKSSDGAAGDGKVIVPGPSGKGQLEAVSELKEFGKWNSRVGVKIAGKWYSIVGKAEKIQAVLADVDEGDLVEYTTKENRWTGKDGNQNIDFWITSLKRTSPATREGQEDVHVPVPEEKLDAKPSGNVPARERPVQAEVELLAGWDDFRARYTLDVQDAKTQTAEIIVQVKTLLERVRDLQAVVETKVMEHLLVTQETTTHAAEQAALATALLRKERATEKPAGEVPITPLSQPAPGLPNPTKSLGLVAFRDENRIVGNIQNCKHKNTHRREKFTPFDGLTRIEMICDTCSARTDYKILDRNGKDITAQRQLDAKELS